MYSELETHLKRNHKVTLSSEIEDDEDVYHGYIVGLTRNLVCLWLVVDWHHDGFAIMPVKYVTGIRHGKYEKTYHRVLKSEGCLADVAMPGWLKIGSYKAAFNALKANCNNMIVESRLPPVDEFVVGEIRNVTDKEVHMKGFDATGNWQDGSYKIPFKEITVLKFGDEYSTVFRKYVA